MFLLEACKQILFLPVSWLFLIQRMKYVTFVLCVRLSAGCKTTALWDCLVTLCYT